MAEPEPKARAMLAQWRTQAPEPVRLLLLTDPDDSVRAAACSTYYRRIPHPRLPAEDLTRLLAVLDLAWVLGLWPVPRPGGSGLAAGSRALT
ncbi:hypothetical protein ACIQU4_19710 [Streptomyces sp. NPDC090741]|uniref:hypothetical protein n=1 Tax=Streptomyces sp. NPDC090741 TaxID=3365967 RepID=UPI0037FCDFC7